MSPAVPAAVKGRLRRLPGAARLRSRREVRRLLATGRFDADWYAEQTGSAFGSPAEAAQDYLRRGRRAGLSPNPLFEPEHYDADTALTRPDDPFTGYLGRIGQLRTLSPHLLLDPAAVIAADPAAATHRHGPLGWVLDHRDSAPIPVPVGEGVVEVPWGPLREQLAGALGQWRAQEALRRAPRRSRTFDEAAQRRWQAAVLAGPDPVAQPAGSPLVSVVLPVRNRSGLLRRAVESVRAQTLPDWELVVVDDGSTDDTPQVLEGLAAVEPRIRVVRQSGGGVSRARNQGIAQAQGEYLAFLDSDNAWRPDFLRLAVRAMHRDGLQVAYAAMELRDGAGRREYRAFDGGREHLLLGNHIDLNVLLARTELVRAVGGFAEDLRRAVDYDLVLRLSARAEPGYLPFIGARYAADAADSTRISVAEPLAWDFVVRSRHSVDWAGALAAVGRRVPGRVSVVVPVRDDAAVVARCAAALTAGLGEGDDVEIVVADLGSRRGESLALAALELVHPRLRVHRVPVDAGPALGANLALPHTTGEFVAVCHPDVVVPAGWLPPLRDALAAPAAAVVQPLVLDAAGAVAAAGATFTAAPGQPVPLLHGHPVEDAGKLGAVAPLPAADGPLWLARAADVLAVRGLDPLMPPRWQATDLTLRIARQRGADPADPAGRLVTGVHAVLTEGGTGPATGRVPAGANLDDTAFRQRWADPAPATGRSLWRQAGFAVTGHRLIGSGGTGSGGTGSGGTGSGSALDPRVVACVARGWRAGLAADPSSGGADDRPALRWRVRGSAAVRGSAEAIAAALRRWEQDAVVDLSGLPAGQGELDDVTLVLAGPGDPVPAPDGATPALLWLLDPGAGTAAAVGAARAAGYLRVLWAGGEVPAQAAADGAVAPAARPPAATALSPAIDPMLFRPAAADESPAALLVPADLDEVSPLLRAAVHAAVRAGVPVDVRGRGWEAFLPPGTAVAPPLTPHRRAGAYAAARAVLLDAAVPGGGGAPAAGVLPWTALQAVACAAPVLLAGPGGPGGSGGDAGTEAAWSLVRSFAHPQELLELLDLITRSGGDLFGGTEARTRVARSVAVSDSFDARAFRLVQVAAGLPAPTATPLSGR